MGTLLIPNRNSLSITKFFLFILVALNISCVKSLCIILIEGPALPLLSISIFSETYVSISRITLLPITSKLLVFKVPSIYKLLSTIKSLFIFKSPLICCSPLTIKFSLISKSLIVVLLTTYKLLSINTSFLIYKSL